MHLAGGVSVAHILDGGIVGEHIGQIPTGLLQQGIVGMVEPDGEPASAAGASAVGFKLDGLDARNGVAEYRSPLFGKFGGGDGAYLGVGEVGVDFHHVSPGSAVVRSADLAADVGHQRFATVFFGHLERGIDQLLLNRFRLGDIGSVGQDGGYDGIIGIDILHEHDGEVLPLQHADGENEDGDENADGDIAVADDRLDEASVDILDPAAEAAGKRLLHRMNPAQQPDADRLEEGEQEQDDDQKAQLGRKGGLKRFLFCQLNNKVGADQERGERGDDKGVAPCAAQHF